MDENNMNQFDSFAQNPENGTSPAGDAAGNEPAGNTDFGFGGNVTGSEPTGNTDFGFGGNGAGSPPTGNTGFGFDGNGAGSGDMNIFGDNISGGYEIKKKKSKKDLVIGISVAAMGLSLTNMNEARALSVYKGLPIYYCDSSYCIDVESINEMVSHADYVFVGTVTDCTSESYKNKISLTAQDGNSKLWGEPYTNYDVSVINNIKGKLSDKIEIQKFGGLDQSGEFYIIPEGDVLLEERNTYVFFAYKQNDGSLIVRGKNSSLIYNEELMDEISNAVN